MATAEHREPCESRGSRTLLGAPGGEILSGDSSRREILCTSIFRLLYVGSSFEGRRNRRFGAEADAAMQRRREALVDKGYAWRAPDGGIRAPKDLVARLERAQFNRFGKSLAAEKHAPFKMKGEGERVSGVFTGTTDLVSGKCAVIENAHEFTLVPWRPVMDGRLGRQISGGVRASGSHGILPAARPIGVLTR